MIIRLTISFFFTFTVAYSQQVDLRLLNKRLAIELVKYKGDTCQTDSMVTNLAYYHALDMAENKYCGHNENFEASQTFSGRLHTFIPGKFDYAPSKSFEICSFFHFNGDTNNLPKAIINSFKNSPGHWKHITSKASKNSFIGCGIIIRNGVYYCTIVGCDLKDTNHNRALFKKCSKEPTIDEINLDNEMKKRYKECTGIEGWTNLNCLNAEEVNYEFIDFQAIEKHKLIMSEFVRRKKLLK